MSVATSPLKAPFPWFGGKSRVSGIVWPRFGEVRNYVEPFYGSGAVLLGSPRIANTETVNDKDGYVANFWRAVQADPKTVSFFADNPVFENDLHARHSWLVNRKEGFTAQMDGDPDFYDAKVAGWWCWGLCCWIGRDWCSGKGPWRSINGKLVNTRNAGRGVNRQLVHLGNAGRGVNRARVRLGPDGNGMHLKHGDYLREWMCQLAERLLRVRVCCGDWRRVCGGKDGKSLRCLFASGGLCGVFLDPPYPSEAQRDAALYREEDLAVAHDAAEWAIEHGDDARMRIAFCGYEGSHKFPRTWRCVPWKGPGGYASQAQIQNGNSHRERIWFSPHCLQGARP